MKAIVYTECGPADKVLRYMEVPDAVAGPNEALIRIEASGINPHDTKKRSGWLPPTFPAGGIIPHGDGAGVVIETGPGCDPAWKGQRVFFGSAPAGRGTAAELCAVNASHLFSLPDSVTAAEGASLGVPAFTAWLCTLNHGSLLGQRILVHGGSGAVGRVVVEMATWAGARVIATAGNDERSKIPAERGAEHVLNYRDVDLAEQVMSLTDGAGIDHVIDVDFAGNMACNALVMKQNGMLSSYSSTSNRTPVFDYYGFALKGVRINLIQGAVLTPQNRQLAGNDISALLHQGRIRPDVSDILPMADAAAAHDLVENGKARANVAISPVLGAGGNT